MKWIECSLNKVAQITMGQSPPGSTYNESGQGLPFFQGKAEFGDKYPFVKKWCSSPTRRAYKNDILLSVRAPVGPTNLAPSECCIGRGLSAIRALKNILDQNYLWFFFKKYAAQISRQGLGSTFSAINRKEINRLKIPIPSLTEQRRIVVILDQADRLRKLRTEADKKTRRILPTLFIKMFGDPATNPMGWSTSTLGDLTLDLRYGTSVRCETKPQGLPVLRIPNIVSGQILIGNLKYAKLSKKQATPLLLEDGDILFVRTNGNRNYVGRCAVFDLNDEYLYASYLIRARLDKTKANSKFLVTIFNTPVGRQSMEPFIRTTAGQSNISQEGLRQIPVILPPLPLQIDFVHQVEKVTDQQARQASSKGKIEALFSSLLYQAFTGDLTASWRQTHMKELLREMELQAKALAT